MNPANKSFSELNKNLLIQLVYALKLITRLLPNQIRIKSPIAF
jgi:hypothetical protein